MLGALSPVRLSVCLSVRRVDHTRRSQACR